ncbi:Uncharacterized protein TPAR_05639 [Tolypocladium paradoxum]|uniref:Uncharacterized protein n=1 Tax=Tolypocladium paradoxum TaxID=94208 RepID=A0A2S4KVD2_9HYPO|nr:Uncharacterized protein TPAR_05639 [Tolypocladium paradoxum]
MYAGPQRHILATARGTISPASFVPARRLTPLRRRAAPATPPGAHQALARRQSFSSSRLLGEEMASDEDYMAFLNKANKDLSEAQAQARAERQEMVKTATLKTVDDWSDVPKAIEDVCKSEVYVSEADEPFEVVSLKWHGKDGLPNEFEFAKLINHWSPESADVDILDPLDWDSRGQYTRVIEAVREAGWGNDVRVYRVGRDHARVEYWVVTSEEGRLVGAKALAIES